MKRVKAVNCAICHDEGFINRKYVKSWAFHLPTMTWQGICPYCDAGWDKVDTDDNYTDVKQFGGKREEL